MIKQFIAAAALSAAIASPAMAAADGAPNGEIEYSDLDLSTDEGVAELDTRIERAARFICEMDVTTTGSRVVPKEKRNCVKTVRVSAKKQLASVIERARRGG